MDKQTLVYIGQMIADTYSLPVLALDGAHNPCFEANFSQQRNPVYPSDAALAALLLKGEAHRTYPVWKLTTMQESYLLFRFDLDESFGYLMVGPMLLARFDEEKLSAMLLDVQLPRHLLPLLMEHYTALTLVNQAQIMQIARLTQYLLTGLKLDVLSTDDTPAEDLHPYIESDLQVRRIDAVFHLSQLHEDKMWQCIKEGDVDQLKHVLSHINDQGSGLLSKKSQLRHFKNQGIIAAALAARAAIRGGLYQEIAYTISDTYIQRIEETHRMPPLYRLIQECLLELATHVAEHQSDHDSAAVRACKQYIFNHLYQPLSIPLLAEHTRLHPVYLSHLFKKETGQPLGQYIMQCKIEEAKKLLRQNEHAITEIAMLLQFHSHSHFASAFKKATKMTPLTYRKHPI